MVRREARRMRSLELSKDPTPHLLSSSCTVTVPQVLTRTVLYHYGKAAL
jgi:hypothetical protein